jgi:hypothetical protein
MAHQQVGRNDPCPCGSGKKYKRCHLEEDLAKRVTRGVDGEILNVQGPNNTVMWAIAGLITIAGVVLAAMGHIDWGIGVGVGGLIILGAWVIIRNPPPPNKDDQDPSGINFGN